MFDIAICDDICCEAVSLKECILKLDEFCDEMRIHIYQSEQKLLNDMKRINFSLIFLDVHLDNLSGYTVASKIREENDNIVLVFYSWDENPPIVAIEIQPFRYISKNFTEQAKLKDIRDSIIKMKEIENAPILEGKYDNRKIYIRIRDIIYIEKYKKNNRVHIAKTSLSKYKIKEEDYILKDIRVTQKLETLYEVLSPYGFGYPHNSYVINFKYLISCTDSEFILDEYQNIQFKISRSKMQEFNKQKQNFMCTI